MTDLIAVREKTPWFRRLYLPAYGISEAARYAHIAPETATAWHRRSISTLGPALPEREQRKPLNYLELVEIAVVAVFRTCGVPLRNVQEAHAYMAKNFSSEFPFAEFRFKSDGFHLLTELRELVPAVSSDDLVVADAGGQLGWNALMQDKLFSFDYDTTYELALRWWVAGRSSKVVIDPRVAFGAPTVRGIPTFVLRGRWDAGETIGDMREDFRLDEPELRDALLFEGVSRDLIFR